jgi:hypothetical protein
MRIYEKTNYSIVNQSITGRMAITDSGKALNHLECFANICLFLQERLIEKKLISNTDYNLVDRYGFCMTINDEWLYFVEEETQKKFFLFNYHSLFRKWRTEYETTVMTDRMYKKFNCNKAVKEQSLRFLIRCAVGCITDRFCLEKKFQGYWYWNNAVWDVVDKYSFELNKFIHFLSLQNNNREEREKILTEKYKIDVQFLIDRSELKG